MSKDLNYEGKEKQVTFNQWQMASNTFRRQLQK